MAYGNNNNNNRNNSRGNGLDKYETVKQRKVRLRLDFPDSVIIPMPLSDLNYAGNYILMGALIWKDKASYDALDATALKNMGDLTANVNSMNIGIVMATLAVLAKADGSGYSLSMAGGKGADKTSWVENAEESAVGRALDNMGYHSGSASQEEMQKVQHMEQVLKERVELENGVNSAYSRLSTNGYQDEYLSQMIAQTVRPFTQLSELNPTELTALRDLLTNLANTGAYQQQTQPAYQPNPQNYSQQVGPPPPVPGAPAPAPQAPQQVG